MTRTLWIYGDSFAVDWKVDWCWQRQLAGYLRIDRVVNQACAGSSNEWSAMQFRDDKQQPGDIVIFFTTEQSRQWFFKDRPHLSNLASITDTQDAKALEKAEPEKYKAIMDYWLYLQRDDVDQLRMEHMIDSIRVKQIENELHLLLIPSFDSNMMWTDLIPVIGNMTFSICDREFVNEQEMLLWYNQSIDTRANHMTLANHSIFAEKIVQSISNKKELNLDTGFEKGFLTHKDKLSHPGLLPELVEKAIGPGNSLPKSILPKVLDKITKQ